MPSFDGPTFQIGLQILPDIEKVRPVLAAMEEAKASGLGATTYKGKLIDIASMKQAEVIVRMAELVEG